MLASDREAIRLAWNTLNWLLDQPRDSWHRGLSGTLTAARTQLDAAVKLSEEK